MNAILFRALLLLLCAGPALAGETAVQLDTGKGVLHGTLLTPEGAARMPAVLIVPGSGPTDRNGNFPQMGGINNSLKLLAEGLARHGIASLRFDKRGIAASAPAAPSEAEMRIEQGADDAAGWIRRLRADPRFDRVALIGHSEGALVGMLAAQRAPVDAYVSLAGIGRPFDVVLREQLRPQLPAPLFEESERVLRELLAGRTTTLDAPALVTLYRPSVQPYLISVMRQKPAELIAQVRAPVLLVQGTVDIQVKVEDARLLQAARPDAKLVLVEDMNHVLKLVGKDLTLQMQSYSRPDLPVAPKLVEAVAEFVRAAPAR
jgi:pimeloyl-ACP methyl ester carboxylesterase